MTELVAATLNTHWGLDVAGVAYDVVGAVAALDADLIALQECWRPDRTGGYVPEAAAALGMDHAWGPFVGGPHGGTWRRVHAEDETDAAFGVAVLSRWPILQRRIVPLGKMPRDMNRSVLEVVVDVGGRRVRFAAVHLCMLPHGSLFQLLQLRTLLRGRSDEAVVVAGDCNMWGPVVSTLTGWRRARCGPTWPSHHPHSQIDHVLVQGSVAIDGAEVLPPLGSDHRGLRAHLHLQ